MHKSTLFLALLAIYFTCTCLQCGERCYETDVALSVADIQLKQLDNRGANPVELAPGAQGWRDAYGLRLSANIALKTPADTVTECPYYYPDPYPEGFSIVTLTGIGTQYPPGSEVTSLFKFVYAQDQYRDMSLALSQLVIDWSNIGKAQTDFLLVKPPETAGWQQFELHLFNRDSTKPIFVTDSIYLQ